jgi:glutamine---fructose-6-phosphate transaminase (isomerizing)
MNKFLEEIFEQPEVLETTLNYYLNGHGRADLEKVSSLWKKGKFSQILFTGMGSSYFAPNAIIPLLSSHGINSMNINAGELLHYHLPLIRKGVLLVCTSQSGESYEVVKLLEKIPSGVTVIGITNEEESTLAAKSDLTLLCKAGKELMTSTKTYVSTLLVLSVFSEVLTGTWKPKVITEINNAIESVKTIINTREQWLAPAMNFLGHPSFVQIIGRGSSYASVLQGALMIMEAARNPAAGIYGGEFRHGPLEMSKKGFTAIVFAPVGTTYIQDLKLAEDITRFGGKVILITNSKDSLINPNIYKLNISCRDEYLFPLPAIIPLQFIVNRWATDEGHEPGNFLMGAKVTTTE